MGCNPPKVGVGILTISWVLSSLVAVGLTVTSRLWTSDFVKGWMGGGGGWALTSLLRLGLVPVVAFLIKCKLKIFLNFLPYSYYLKLSVSQFIYLKFLLSTDMQFCPKGSQWVEVQYSDILKLSPCKITHWIIDTQSAMRSRDRRKTFQHLSESVGPLLIYWSRLSDSDEQSVTRLGWICFEKRAKW